MAKIPDELRWLFWDVDLEDIEVDAHANYILPRILEFGRMAEVRWAIATYGLPRIHRFFREVGHPELSARTLHFWRAVLKAEDEEWASPPSWRKTAIAPWLV